MDPNDRILCENEKYKLYSTYENVYLKIKDANGSEKDIFVAFIYGDPDSALISSNNEFVAIAGCGVTIYFLASNCSLEFGTEADDIMWTQGIYQSGEDGHNCVRFTAYTSDNLTRVHKLNVSSRMIEVL